MAKKKRKKKSPSQKTPLEVKVILGVTSPKNSILLPTYPQTPLTVETDSPPPPTKILLLKESSCSEDDDDVASVHSSLDQQFSSSEDVSCDEESVEDDSSSSESETNSPQLVVQSAVLPVVQSAIAKQPVEQLVVQSDVIQPTEQTVEQPAAQSAEQPAAQNPGNLTQTSAPLGQWRNLFASNRSSSNCPKLKYFDELDDANECALLDEDLDAKCDMWKFCVIGYVSGKFPGYKALNAVIANSFHCEAVLTLHESDEMSTVPVWVKLPNLPLRCWSENCLSKIASVIGNPIQCDMLTSSMTRLSYARVLVEIDLRKTLRESVNLCLPNVETCTKYAKKSNISAANGAANANGKGLQQGADNVQALGRQQGFSNDVLPTKDANADGKCEVVKRRQKNNRQNKNTMVESVSSAAARAAGGAAARTVNGAAGKGTASAPVSGAAARAKSSVAAKAVSGVIGMGATIAPVSGAASRPAISATDKAASGVPDVGAEITPVNGAAGKGTASAPVSGAAARAAHGVAGEDSGSAPMRGMSNRVDGVDPLVAAWAISGVTVGADSGIANEAKIVGAKVATRTETIGTTMVSSIEPPCKADSRPKNHANRNSSKGKHIVEEVHGVTTRKGSKSKSSSSGNGRTLPTNPVL
ncbi:hypothetical protein OIU76_029994 [Salix suchowensis]|nr:hypothetical protein OIU76_029994 [Salix suchowensis]